MFFHPSFNVDSSLSNIAFMAIFTIYFINSRFLLRRVLILNICLDEIFNVILGGICEQINSITSANTVPYISLSPAQPKVACPPASLSWLLRVIAHAALLAWVRVCSLWLNCSCFCYNATKWVYFSTFHIHVRFLHANSLVEKWHGYLETDSPISVRLTEKHFVNL